MPDQTFDPQKIGTGEGESPMMAPAQKFDMRTMASDAASAQTGDEPKPFVPSAMPSRPLQTPPSPPPSMATASEKEVAFELPQIDQSTTPAKNEEPPKPPTPPAPPAENITAPAPMPSEQPKTGGMNKGLFVSLISAIAVVAVATAGYFFVYPKFFGGTEEVAQTPPPAEQPTPETQPETPPLQSEVPSATEETPAETIETPTTTETPAETTPVETTAVPEEPYVSLFKTAPDETKNMDLGEVTLTAIKTAIPFETAQTPSLKEYAIKDADGKFVSIAKVLSTFFPTTFTGELSGNFEKGVLFSYADNKGTWLGIAAQLKSDVNASDVQSRVAGMESNTEFANIFITDAGTAGTTWKAGQAEGVNTRYLTYSLSGAGVNYGWLENKLIISASYNGFKEATKRLK